MKKQSVNVLILAGLLMCTSCAADEQKVEYNVTGTAPAGVEKVYIVEVSNRYANVDSATVSNGKFSLSGRAVKDAFLGVSTESRSFILFINDGNPVSVDLTTGLLRGSALNERLNGYDHHIDSLSSVIQAAVQPYMRAQQEGKSREELEAMVAGIQTAIAPVEEEMTAYAKKIVADNPDNIIPAAFLGNVMYEYELSELKELLSDKYAYASHPLTRQVKQWVAEEEKSRAIIGQQFIDIEENDPEGKPHKLSEYVGRGNYVLIDFWASWCGPCMQEMPNVKANYEKYKGKGFNIVGLSFDRAKEPWVKAIKEHELNWIHLSDLKFWQTIAAKTYGINAIPSSLLVDPQGKVIARDLRGADLGAKLAEIYGE